jgi:HAE1 family hydrophobic/amphiphilic exporter-1
MSLADVCIRRPVFTWMITLLPVVLGLVCYRSLKTSLFPVVDLPIVAVTTVLPGAGADEVESQITKPIEEVINTCSGIEEIRSTSKEGVSTITVEFAMSKNRDAAAQEIRDKVGTLTSQFPVGTETPIIEKFDIDASAILTVAVSADRSFREVTELARKVIKEDIETLYGVGAVNLIGGWKRAVNITVDPDKLRKFGLTVEHVRKAIGEQNVELPGGRVDQGSRELVLRTMGRVDATRSMPELVVASPGGVPVRLRDVATVADGYEEPRSLGRLRLVGDADPGMAAGRNAVVLSVQKQSGMNTVEVTDRVNARLARLRKALPADIRLEIVRDQSKFTRASIEEVRFHLILGAVLVSLTVLVFMRDWRTMLLASASIPVSIIATFVVMWAFGFSLDNITMIGLVLAVGIVIDDAVVIHENIFRFIEEKGLDPITASSEATKEIALAVVATTLSLVVIFLPLAFLGGRIGPFFMGFGIVIASAVLLSMWISFTMTPMFCSRFLKAVPGGAAGGAGGMGGHGHGHQHGGFLYRAFDRFYGMLLRFSLRRRWVIVLLAVGVLYSIGPLGAMIGKDFIPKDDQGEIEVAFVTPEGWTLAETDAAAKAVEETLLKELPGVEKTLTTLGETTGKIGKAQGDVTSGVVYVGLTDLEHRTFSWRKAAWDAAGLAFGGEPGLLLRPAELKARLRALQPGVFSQFDVARLARKALVARFPDLRIAVREVSPFSGVGVRAGDLELNIRGPDLERLEEYSEKLMAEMRKIPGLVDIDSTLALRKPELRVRIDRDAAARHGIRVAGLASTLGVLVGGEVIGRYVEGAEQYDIWLRADPAVRADPARIADMTVPAADGRLIPLRLLAKLEEARGPAQIDRYLRQRKVTIVCGLDGLPTNDAAEQVRKKVALLNLPPDYILDFTGRAKTSGESGGNFLIAFGLGFLLMYMILAAQFESFLHPITILLSVPLTVPFALASLILMGQPLDIYAMFGLFMLFGIVKKNGILQVDYTNVLRARGMPREEAIIEANHTRLRPILMTTFMLVAGMIPIATGQGPGAGARASMAKVIVGGQALSLILTLLIVPVAYSLFDDAAILLRRVRGWLTRTRATPPAEGAAGTGTPPVAAALPPN